MRSIWKGIPHLDFNLLKFHKIRLYNNKYKITSNYIGKIFEIYNGCRFLKFKITKNMIGHFFGEFVFTRKFNPTHNKKKKLKKKLMVLKNKQKKKKQIKKSNKKKNLKKKNK